MKQVGSADVLQVQAAGKLFMMQSLYHMDIDPARPHGYLKVAAAIVHVANFPPETTRTEHILACFTDGGVELTSLEVLWIDGTSTFVAVKGADTAEDIIPKLVLPEGNTWVVQSYEAFKNPPAPAAAAVPEEPAAAAAAAVPMDVGATEVGVQTDDGATEDHAEKRLRIV